MKTYHIAVLATGKNWDSARCGDNYEGNQETTFRKRALCCSKDKTTIAGCLAECNMTVGSNREQGKCVDVFPVLSSTTSTESTTKIATLTTFSNKTMSSTKANFPNSVSVLQTVSSSNQPVSTSQSTDGIVFTTVPVIQTSPRKLDRTTQLLSSSSLSTLQRFFTKEPSSTPISKDQILQPTIDILSSETTSSSTIKSALSGTTANNIPLTTLLRTSQISSSINIWTS
ncbi:hypothetical protein DPMN_124933 [Dreissena polymorpha]|uniref:Uncharacterized protein n=1 Tax=Dreissena polymorpha TaxID=45954 RepID=A0A9D4GTH8_DREPO|nr:hypothetical protein DPMN_124933 [Dreissena polymorpha]